MEESIFASSNSLQSSPHHYISKDSPWNQYIPRHAESLEIQISPETSKMCNTAAFGSDSSGQDITFGSDLPSFSAQYFDNGFQEHSPTTTGAVQFSSSVPVPPQDADLLPYNSSSRFELPEKCGQLDVCSHPDIGCEHILRKIQDHPQLIQSNLSDTTLQLNHSCNISNDLAEENLFCGISGLPMSIDNSDAIQSAQTTVTTSESPCMWFVEPGYSPSNTVQSSDLACTQMMLEAKFESNSHISQPFLGNFTADMTLGLSVTSSNDCGATTITESWSIETLKVVEGAEVLPQESSPSTPPRTNCLSRPATSTPPRIDLSCPLIRRRVAWPSFSHLVEPTECSSLNAQSQSACNTPDSDISSPNLSTDMTAGWSCVESPSRCRRQPVGSPRRGVSESSSKSALLHAIGENDCSGQLRRRQLNRPKHNHSKIATDLFKEWFYRNLQNPFPSDAVKAAFADRTGLNYTQVSNWFINARKRVWKPLNMSDLDRIPTTAARSPTDHSPDANDAAARWGGAPTTPSKHGGTGMATAHSEATGNNCSDKIAYAYVAVGSPEPGQRAPETTAWAGAWYSEGGPMLAAPFVGTST